MTRNRRKYGQFCFVSGGRGGVGEEKILFQVDFEPDICPFLSSDKTSDVVQLENIFCFHSEICESNSVVIS
jgi:hypothetical protein